MSDLYRDQLLFASKDTRHRGVLREAQVIERKANPSCGDVVVFYAKLDGDVIQELKFEGQGCVISMASAAVTAHELEGKKLGEVLALTKEDVLKYLDIQVGPMRESCLMLGVEALQRGILLWKKG